MEFISGFPGVREDRNARLRYSFPRAVLSDDSFPTDFFSPDILKCQSWSWKGLASAISNPRLLSLRYEFFSVWIWPCEFRVCSRIVWKNPDDNLAYNLLTLTAMIMSVTLRRGEAILTAEILTAAQVRGRGSRSAPAARGAKGADTLVDPTAEGRARGGWEGTAGRREGLSGSRPFQGQARGDAGAYGGRMPTKVERNHGQI